MNAITMLKDDHKKVLGLLAELEATTPRAIKTRAQLLDKIARELYLHTRVEEEIFYPALRRAGDKSDEKMFFEATEEHKAVEDLVLPHLQGTDPSTECFSGRAKVLRELVEHHAKEEEREMFPRMQKLLSLAELRQLGQEMAQKKQQILVEQTPKPLAATLLDTLAGVNQQVGKIVPSHQVSP